MARVAHDAGTGGADYAHSSGFYAGSNDPSRSAGRAIGRLPLLIRASHEASPRSYGSPRLHEDLIEQGIAISRKRVAGLMRAEGLRARLCRGSA